MQLFVVGTRIAAAVSLALAGSWYAAPPASSTSAQEMTPVATVQPGPTVEAPLPPTPGPPSPTHALPEEGGPPGGIIGGRVIFEDAAGQRGPGGGTIIIDFLDPAGNEIDDVTVAIDPVTGRFEARALPAGRYRVIWEPPLPPELIVSITPPLTDVVIAPNTTIRAAVIDVELAAAARVLALEFFLKGRPATGEIELPSSGTGSSGGIPAGALAATMLVPLGALAGLEWLRRRSAS